MSYVRTDWLEEEMTSVNGGNPLLHVTMKGDGATPITEDTSPNEPIVGASIYGVFVFVWFIHATFAEYKKGEQHNEEWVEREM